MDADGVREIAQQYGITIRAARILSRLTDTEHKILTTWIESGTEEIPVVTPEIAQIARRCSTNPVGLAALATSRPAKGGRAPSGDCETWITVRVPERVSRELGVRAAGNGMSKSSYARMLLASQLD